MNVNKSIQLGQAELKQAVINYINLNVPEAEQIAADTDIMIRLVNGAKVEQVTYTGLQASWTVFK